MDNLIKHNHHRQVFIKKTIYQAEMNCLIGDVSREIFSVEGEHKVCLLT